jgi:hypothetical protein
LSAGTRNFLVIIVVVIAIPLLTFAVLWMRGAKVIAVRNDCGCRVEITATISDGTYVERADSKLLDPDQTGWFYFFPKVSGPMILRCVSSDSVARLPLGIAPARFQYSAVVLDSCKSMAKIPGFVF